MKPRPLIHRLRAWRRAAFPWLSRPGVLGPVTGGVLLLAFPPLEWTPVAWVALAPLLVALEGEGDSARRRGVGVWFGAGWGMGLVLAAGNYHWMIRAMVELAGVPLVRFLPFWLAMVAFFALGPALVLAACAAARARLGWALWWTAPLGFMLVDTVLLQFPFGGMPWGSLAATQPHTLAASWIAPVFGGPGVVAAMIAVNAGWATLADTSSYSHRSLSPAVGAGLLAATVAVLLWPAPANPDPPSGSRALRAVLVPSDLAPSAPDDALRIRHYIGRTLGAADLLRGPAAGKPGGSRLVIWPESAAGFDVSRGKALVELHEVANLVDSDILFGSDIREQGKDYNALYLVTGATFDFQRYEKRNLVPFGEYVPTLFRPLFGRKATAGDEDYIAGERPPVLTWRGRFLGVAICFESILPHHIATAVHEGAQVLVVIANDIWLTPPAYTHHLRLTALRALEAGRDALFVSNGGYTALLSGGRAVEMVSAGQGPLRVEARLESRVTPWVRWGVLLPLGFVVLVVAIRVAGYGVAYVYPPRSTRLPMG